MTAMAKPLHTACPRLPRQEGGSNSVPPCPPPRLWRMVSAPILQNNALSNNGRCWGCRGRPATPRTVDFAVLLSGEMEMGASAVRRSRSMLWLGHCGALGGGGGAHPQWSILG